MGYEGSTPSSGSTTTNQHTMININYDLLHSFLRCRQVNGIPTAVDILTRIAKTKTTTFVPPGWKWR